MIQKIRNLDPVYHVLYCIFISYFCNTYVYYSYCKYFHTLVGKYEWSFGKRGLGMTQEGLGALPGLGIRADRAVVRWNKASRLMRRKTSTDMVNLNLNPTLQYCKGVGRVVNHKGGTSLTKKVSTRGLNFRPPEFMLTLPFTNPCGHRYDR